MAESVLFLCPHNAAKSVLALAYFRREAARRGLACEAWTAGTEPDAAVWPSVIELLAADGIEAPPEQPRRVVQADLDRASRIVSLGCDLSGFTLRTALERWDDVPLASEDLIAARDAIRSRVEALVAALSRAPAGPGGGGQRRALRATRGKPCPTSSS